MSAHLAIAAAAGLAALAAVKPKGSRSLLALDRKIFDRFGKVHPGSAEALSKLEDRASFLDDFEHNLSTAEQLLPALTPRYKAASLEIDERPDSNAWYLGGGLRFTSHRNTPGFVSHQSIHMLDDEKRAYKSEDPSSSSFALAKKAREVARTSLDAYMDALVAERLAALPQPVYALLASGETTHAQVHPLLADAFGYQGDPRKISRLLQEAAAPFGGVYRHTLDAQLDNPKLVDALMELSSMTPVGLPMTVRTEADKQRHFQRYIPSEMRRKLSYYTLDRKELFARLMDQVLREEALRRGRPIRRIARARPDDVPLDLLPELEDDAWSVIRERGWDRS